MKNRKIKKIINKKKNKNKNYNMASTIETKEQYSDDEKARQSIYRIEQILLTIDSKQHQPAILTALNGMEARYKNRIEIIINLLISIAALLIGLIVVLSIKM